MNAAGASMGILSVVMGLLAGSLIIRNDHHWPVAVALIGMGVILAVVVLGG